MAKRSTSMRLSEAADWRLKFLARRFGNQTTAVEVALTRLYEQEAKHMIGYTVERAAREAVTHHRRWMGGAVVVRYTDGSYDAVPQPHFTDISWSGRNDLEAWVAEVRDLADWGVNDGRDLDDLAPDEIEWLIDQVAEVAKSA